MKNPRKKFPFDPRQPSRAEMRRNSPRKSNSVPGGNPFSPGILPSSDSMVVVPNSAVAEATTTIATGQEPSAEKGTLGRSEGVLE
jgi:hypothetical protein